MLANEPFKCSKYALDRSAISIAWRTHTRQNGISQETAQTEINGAFFSCHLSYGTHELRGSLRDRREDGKHAAGTNVIESAAIHQIDTFGNNLEA